MEVRILFDKQALNKDLYTGWGISILINGSILFDTGENGEWLLHNMQQLDIKIDSLKSIVISHDHWDHTGGIYEILKRKELKVYGCPHFSKEFINRIQHLGAEFIGADKFIKISEGIFLSGEILGQYTGGSIAEQALIIKTEKGISVLTGCSHPGIINMLEYVNRQLPKERFYSVIGGLHLIEHDHRVVRMILEKFKRLEVRRVGITHCSGKGAEDIFQSEYKDDFITVRVGQTIEL